MAITGLVHVNVNCSDYDRSRALYAVLGFQEVWRVPERNTPEVAAAVGMRPPYAHLYNYCIARVALASNARFVFFKDSDGTVPELIENSGR